ncbi:snRNA-activating protein complex subunit 3 [Strigomonas culicis]|nr:snRNA-activating protein complex subunit 3 [Strigomonas culicis]|eukprot:EPY31206.1 snRNA-activating protein complex subunit 3 [Strigomonas culicis]
MPKALPSRVTSERREAVDPFLYIVSEEDAQNGMSLLDLCIRRLCISLADVQRINRANGALDQYRLDECLPVGTAIRLPVVVTVCGGSPPYSSYFALGREEERLRGVERRLGERAAAFEAAHGSGALELPPRTVLSQTEQATDFIHKEVERQLPLLQHITKLSDLVKAVDVEPIKKREREIVEAFSPETVRLRSFQALPGPAPKRRRHANDISPSTIATVLDPTEDFCVEHTHRWEFMFYTNRTLAERETWAVLSCQPLTALMDALECYSQPLYGKHRNAFFFIGGTFYIDDRHRGEEDYEDLSAAIRNYDPVANTAEFAGANLGFGACPVRSAAETRFADLQVKMGEYCVYQHLDRCSHAFALHGVRPLGPNMRTQRNQFPHRTMVKKGQVILCQMCGSFPSTIALFDDPLSPSNPSMYCAYCYEVLHGDDTEEEAQKYVKVNYP